MEQLRLEALYLGTPDSKGNSTPGVLETEYHFDLLTDKSRILTKLQEERLVSIQETVISLQPAPALPWLTVFP